VSHTAVDLSVSWKALGVTLCVIASGWEMEDLCAYTMCKHTLTIQLQVRAGRSGECLTTLLYVTLEPQLAPKVLCSQDYLDVEFIHHSQ